MTYDGIVIGAGHNGMFTAAYLARAGLKIAVLESRLEIGGGFATEAVTAPGFKHQLHAHYVKIHESPMHGDLELEKYGVKYVFPEPKMAIIKKDNYFLYYQSRQKTYESIKHISAKDAETYLVMAEKWHQWYLDFVLPELYSAPLPPAEWRDWVLSKPGGEEYLDAATNYSAVEYAAKIFESAYCRLAIVRGATAAEYDVHEKGLPALVMATMMSWFVGSTAHVVGGCNMIPQACRKIVEECGGLVRTNSKVAKIIIEEGRAAGVLLEDGTEFRASQFVASSIDPVHTFLFMLEPEHVPAEVAAKAEAFQFSGKSLFRVHLALKERPHFTWADQEPVIDDAWKFTIGFEDPGDFARIGEQIDDGDLPIVTGIDMGLSSIFDSTQAPAGRHVAYVGFPAPFNLKDGGADNWPTAGRVLAAQLLDKLREYAPNMTEDNIIGRFIYSPKDIEEYLPDMIEGDICQGKICGDQLGYNRPWAGMSQYQTHIANLYLCGSSTHPGGHTVGGPGYNAANRIAEDLGIKKWWPKFDPYKTVDIWR